MRHYLFTVTEENSENEGESFLVGAESINHAWELAQTVFPDDDLEYDGRLSDFEAEMSGLDEY